MGWPRVMTAAALVCGSCGIELPPNSKFCNECGAAVATATTPAEYKQVTVLFADVVGSMDIAAAVELERLREIMTELVDCCTKVVQRYGGGTLEHTGDGVMAIFGAPVALEDHAFRACLAALAIQEGTTRLVGEVARRDGVALRLRVGLNSGRVIAGEIGSGSLGYAATGEPVGFAQRMESVAPPGGVMLSESTARLVEHLVVLGEPEWVRIKGADDPVRARRLVAIGARDGLVGRTEASLVGRRWEMAALEAMVDRAIGGRGGVVGVVGVPGIGKSRTARETAALAAGRGVEVFWAFCESHAIDIPFYAVTRLLRASTGVADLDDEAARARVREQVPDADPQDLLLLEDLLGIADPEVALPAIDPDARRRRLTALINAASLARSAPALYIIEDAQWIDAVSESMLAAFFTVIPQTPSMLLITARPEYPGALTRVPGSQTIALAPLGDADSAALIGELLGSDPSVGELAAALAERAAGNPFFAEEMVRELAQRGVLAGERGGYVGQVDVAEVSVPATVQAAIEARIDRLNTPAKRTLHAASVIGARFGAQLLAALGIDAVVDEPLGAELIDQVRFSPSAEYAFRHPLIRAVAYESQLKSDRAEWHRRVAAAIESTDPAAAEDNAALIAEHLEAAGDLHTAYGWHMRAATWATNGATELGARPNDRRRIARRGPQPGGHAHCPAHHVVRHRLSSPYEYCRGPLRGTAGVVHRRRGQGVAGHRHGRAGDRSRVSGPGGRGVAAGIGSYGPYRVGRRCDPHVGLSFRLLYAKSETAEVSDVLRWSQRVIDLADGDPSKGNFIVGSPLACAFTMRGIARYCLGRPGWRDDLRHALAMARGADPMSYANVVALVYLVGIPFGVVAADDRAVHECEDALQNAERCGDDFALAQARGALGVTLVHRHTAAERGRGHKLLVEACEMCRGSGQALGDLPLVEVYVARERARRGDRDEAIPLIRAAVEHLSREGQLLAASVPATGVLVETLLDRGTEGDVAEAEAAIERLAAAPAEEDLAIREIWLPRLRALLARARARGDDVGYRDLVSRYRAMAKSLGFEGHMAWAEAM